VQAIASQIQLSLKAKIDPLIDEIKTFDDKQNKKFAIQEKAANLISQGFSKSLKELSNWLHLPTLLAKYQTDGAVALAENKFKSWQTDKLKKDLTKLQLDVVKWLTGRQSKPKTRLCKQCNDSW
jgi:predicted transcriptional regulator